MTSRPHRRTSRPRAFTLIELLVSIGIIAVLGGLTAVAVQGLARDARLSSGMNTVTAMLNNARTLAMKDNTVVAVAFRARWDTADPKKRQQTEVVIARWSGETWLLPDGSGGLEAILDRFIPDPSAPARLLPPGIKVAAPWYDRNLDDIWITQPQFDVLATVGEQPGRQFAIVYGPDGTVQGFNPLTKADQLFVDYNQNRQQDYDFADPMMDDGGDFWEYDHPSDEVNVNPVPFLAVYDDDAARDLKVLNWQNETNQRTELRGPEGFIASQGRRIYFNRYSGVVMSREGG